MEPEIPLHLLDADAVRVVARLRQHGHQAYLVGGCVRDLLLGLRPKDFDVATSAHPGEVRAIFRNSRLIGRRFRLALIIFKDKWIEVSTFRSNPSDSEPEPEPTPLVEAQDADGELPPGLAAEAPVDPAPGSAEAKVEEDLLISDDNVFGTAEEDARRRDFTVNGLFYDPGEGRVVDHVRGLRDLHARRIRTVGDPEVRMREDPVRLLRAARFSARLGLDIEPRTYAAMEGAVEDLARCAQPRLLDNVLRMLRGSAAEKGIQLLYALGALRITLPPLAHFLEEGGEEAAKAVAAHAKALDERTLAGFQWDEAQLLAAVLLPLARAEPVSEVVDGKVTVAPAVDALLEEWVRAARFPRKWAERCKSLLWAQRTLSGERRRRGSLNSFRTHPVFEDALELFELSVEATGQFQAELAVWKEGGAPVPVEGAPGPARKRRRRRRGGAGRAGAAGTTEGGQAVPGGSDDGAAAGPGGDPGSDEAPAQPDKAQAG